MKKKDGLNEKKIVQMKQFNKQNKKNFIIGNCGKT